MKTKGIMYTCDECGKQVFMELMEPENSIGIIRFNGCLNGWVHTVSPDGNEDLCATCVGERIRTQGRIVGGEV